MAFLYGLLRALAAAMRLVASRRHARAQQRYEQLEERFRNFETDCKADEVQFGSPVGYNAQLRLLKAFESKERARNKWVRAAGLLERRERRELWLKEFSGRKLPYSFGIADMALIMHAIDRFGLLSQFDWAAVMESLRSLL